MSRRQRWTPVKGSASRVYGTGERVLLGAADLPGRLLAGSLSALGLRRAPPRPEPAALAEVLVLRLDRIGDLLMSFPALHALRAALPAARIRLAVGEWAAPLADRAPVDQVLVWSAPWAGRPREGEAGALALARRARALARERIDLALDLQGDVRAALLMWLTGARWRVGYANTGGAYLLTHVVPLDETRGWVEQNRIAVEAVLGPLSTPAPTPSPLRPADRERGERLLGELGLAGRRPLVGIHPSGGRPVKQWPVARWAAVAERLAAACEAHFVITGGAADRALAGPIAARLGERARDLAGRLSLEDTLALIARLDLFLSPDTGPMHMACAVGTPSLSVFGPSDPRRYFSGGSGAAGSRHVVVRRELWCSPCNLIRRPPAECLLGEAPECLLGVDVETVVRAALGLLSETSEDRATATERP